MAEQYHYDGSAGRGGYVDYGQAAPSAAPRETSLGSLIDQFDNQLENARKLQESVRTIADRLHGSQPPPPTQDGRSASNALSPPIIFQLQHRINELDLTLRNIDSQLMRIEKAL